MSLMYAAASVHGFHQPAAALHSEGKGRLDTKWGQLSSPNVWRQRFFATSSNAFLTGAAAAHDTFPVAIPGIAADYTRRNQAGFYYCRKMRVSVERFH